MRFTTTLAVATALAVSGFATNAGGLSDEILEVMSQIFPTIEVQCSVDTVIQRERQTA